MEPVQDRIRQQETAGLFQPDNLANYTAELGILEIIEGRDTYSPESPRYHVDAHVAGLGDKRTKIIVSGNTNIISEYMPEFKSKLTEHIIDRFGKAGYIEADLVIEYNLQPTAEDLHKKTNGEEILLGDSRNVQSAAYNTEDHLPCNVSAARKITSELNDYEQILWNNFKIEFNDRSFFSKPTIDKIDVIYHAEALPQNWCSVKEYVDGIIYSNLSPFYGEIKIEPKIFYNEGKLPCVTDKGLSNLKGTSKKISDADGGGVFGVTPNFPDLTGTALLRALAVDTVKIYGPESVLIQAYGEYGTKNFTPVYVDVRWDDSKTQQTDEVIGFVTEKLESTDLQTAIEHLGLDKPGTYELILKNLDVCEPGLPWEKGGLFK